MISRDTTTQTMQKGMHELLSPNAFTPPEGYVFAGWATTPDATDPEYTDEQSVSFDSDTTLYAVWRKGTDGYLEYFNSPMYIQAEEDGVSIMIDKELEYSIDNCSTWNTHPRGDEKILLDSGQRAYFKKDTGGEAFNKNFNIESDKKASVAGNVMSLIGGDNFKDITTMPPNCFSSLFANCFESLISAENLILPAKTLSGYCYSNMFSACHQLVKPPALPATTLASDCYDSMFHSCSSLTQAPELPALVVPLRGYYRMFTSCRKLKNLPNLPAILLYQQAYEEMFDNCGTHSNAYIHALGFQYNSFTNMFEDTSVSTVHMVNTDALGLGTTSSLPNVSYDIPDKINNLTIKSS